MLRFALAVSLVIASLGGQLLAEDDAASSLAPLVEVLGQVDDAGFQLDLLKGMHEALRGRRNVPAPKGWSELAKKLDASENQEVRQHARLLSLIFGDPQVLAALRAELLDAKAELELRKAALESLVNVKAPGLAPVLHGLLADEALRCQALRALAAYDDAATPEKICEQFASFDADARRDAVNTLASRKPYALALLSAMEAGQIARSEMSAFTARQLHGLGDPEITKKLTSVWGVIRETSEDKAAVMAEYRKLLSKDFLKDADLPHGRALFKKTCQQCHTLFGEGGKVGPDLTGSNRNNLDYVLQNVLDPSAVVGKDYQLNTIVTVDGRVLQGLILERLETKLTLRTLNDTVIIDADDIDEQFVQPKSMMPEDLWKPLSTEQVRDLVGYLASPSQVELPAGEEPVAAGQ